MKTVDCTPTWKAAATIYIAVIQQEAQHCRYNSEAMKNATAGIYELAEHLDRINSEQQEKRKQIAERNAKLQEGKDRTAAAE